MEQIYSIRSIFIKAAKWDTWEKQDLIRLRATFQKQDNKMSNRYDMSENGWFCSIEDLFKCLGRNSTLDFKCAKVHEIMV